MRKVLKQFIWDVVGPTAFATLSDDRDRNTSSLETKSSCGTRLGGESRVKGVKWSVRLTKKVIDLICKQFGIHGIPKKLMVPLLLNALACE